MYFIGFEYGFIGSLNQTDFDIIQNNIDDVRPEVLRENRQGLEKQMQEVLIELSNRIIVINKCTKIHNEFWNGVYNFDKKPINQGKFFKESESYHLIETNREIFDLCEMMIQFFPDKFPDTIKV